MGRARVTEARQATLDTLYAEYMAALPDDEAKVNGVSVGERAAAAALAARAADGFGAPVPYLQPPAGPGVWEPTAPTPPVDVSLQQVQPLTFSSPSLFRPDGPNLLTSAEYAADFDEVKSLGRRDSARRTADQTDIARFWSENPAVQWSRGLRTLALDRSLGIVPAARLLAMAHTASADAIIACFDAKYTFLYWRPVHAIRRADTDANPATEADASWEPLLNVNHPEYPSGHACWTGALTETLADYFGTDAVGFRLDTMAGVTQKWRYYARFRQALKEVLDARVYAGLHFRNTLLQGAALGRHVSKHVTRHYFQPVQ